MPPNVRETASSGDCGGGSSSSSGAAGPTPFHRRSSYLPRQQISKKFDKTGVGETPRSPGPAPAPGPGRFLSFKKWHIYDNDGSFNGWFDWIPIKMRVGYWSPVAVVFLVCFYGSVFYYMPRPLIFAPADMQPSRPEMSKYDDDNLWWTATADVTVFVWGLSVMIHGRLTMNSFAAFGISFTGWSWVILTARAGLTAAGRFLSDRPYTSPDFSSALTTLGSALRFPAAVAAFVTFTVWNLVLLPVIYFVATPPGEKRRNFLKFNFGFFMTNVHVLNLPLAMINTVVGGDGAQLRLFTPSDLWVAYLVVMMYSVLYLFVMDRLGLHFYPIFCPRSATCALSFGAVIYLYYDLMHRVNALITHLNPELIAL